MRILQKTANLIDLYLHTRGNEDTPIYFHLWCCLSLIAACVGNRVYFHRVREFAIYPCLYTILVDESGSGKNMAINLVESIASQLPNVNLRKKKLTAQNLIDSLGRPTVDETTGMRYLANTRVYLVQPELAFYFGKGEHAQTLVELLTEMYGGACSVEEGTRTSGDCKIENACINWLAGSTRDWLIKAVTPEAIQSGFFARVVTVYPEAAKPKQVLEPTYPNDYYEVMNHIRTRFWALTQMSGEMIQTPNAKNWMHSWLMNRKEPEDTMIMPAWRRQRELIYRLAMLLCLADGGRMVIRRHHVVRAEKLSRFVLEKNLPDLVAFSARTPQTKPTNAVEEILKRAKKIDRSNLTKRAYKRGVNGEGVRRAVMDLARQELVHVERTSTGKEIYSWIGV